MIISDIDKIDRIARRICYRHRIRKKDMFLNTKASPVVSARHHFYTLCDLEGIKIWEIQRYCERYGYPIDHASILYGINKMKEFEQNQTGTKNLVTALSKQELARERDGRKI
jgi:hypothetical protein